MMQLLVAVRSLKIILFFSKMEGIIGFSRGTRLKVINGKHSSILTDYWQVAKGWRVQKS
jgi:hypothetical protein